MNNGKRINFLVRDASSSRGYRFLPAILIGLFFGLYDRAEIPMKEEVHHSIPVQEVSVVEVPTDRREERTAAPNLGSELESRIRNIPGVVALLEATNVTDGPRIVLQSDDFFNSGTATLKEKSIGAVREVAILIKEAFSSYGIEIEGHTDDTPVVRQRKIYTSNWELSSARAASILHLFEEVGFLKKQLKIIGLGESRPIFPKSSSQNRRIVLHLIPDGNEGGQ